MMLLTVQLSVSYHQYCFRSWTIADSATLLTEMNQTLSPFSPRRAQKLLMFLSTYHVSRFVAVERFLQ